jgi:ABC-type sugar transport system permease subunit
LGIPCALSVILLAIVVTFTVIEMRITKKLGEWGD